MAKQFQIPEMYESPLIRTIKLARQAQDPRKKDLSPAILDFGALRFIIPRHFGFCYGVQNAIDIAYRTLDEAQGRPVYLLGEMIHNPIVNEDLLRRGIKFLFNTDGSERISLDELDSNDIVIVPAFGTTLAIEEQLKSKGIDPYSYNTTCPFVEKVWKRGSQLGSKGYNLVIHGKSTHEETRATFSHAQKDARAVVVVLNTQEAHILADCMLGRRSKDEFDRVFGHKCTPGFDPQKDLERFGVINQTTMLATETQEVIDILREAAIQRFGTSQIEEHVADTSDTLCYATNENQSATLALMEHHIDLALVVGGFNSSNTMHIVELLEKKYPTYHVRDLADVPSVDEIVHYDQWTHSIKVTQNWLDTSIKPLNVAVTSGASCPDSMVDAILLRIMSWVDELRPLDDVLAPFKEQAGLSQSE